MLLKLQTQLELESGIGSLPDLPAQVFYVLMDAEALFCMSHLILAFAAMCSSMALPGLPLVPDYSVEYYRLAQPSQPLSWT